jgi:hypothetical protein
MTGMHGYGSNETQHTGDGCRGDGGGQRARPVAGTSGPFDTSTRAERRFERRQEPTPFHLTDGDLNILNHVARHPFLSSEHFTRLNGDSEQKCASHLRILFDHQFLDRPTTQLALMPISRPRPMVYGLGRRGARALREHSVHADASDWTERAGIRPRVNAGCSL